MLKLGWVQSNTEVDGDVLYLPEGKYLTMDTVRKIEEAKERLEKSNKDAARLGKKPSLPDLQKVSQATLLSLATPQLQGE
jgi:hypothetical protein